jgi:hypothetical protein
MAAFIKDPLIYEFKKNVVTYSGKELPPFVTNDVALISISKSIFCLIKALLFVKLPAPEPRRRR